MGVWVLYSLGYFEFICYEHGCASLFCGHRFSLLLGRYLGVGLFAERMFNFQRNWRFLEVIERAGPPISDVRTF